MNPAERIFVCLLQQFTSTVWKSVIIDQTIMTVFDDLVSQMDASGSNIGVLKTARDALQQMPPNFFINEVFRDKLTKFIVVLLDILQTKEDVLTRSIAERDAVIHDLKSRKPVVHLQPTVIEFTLSR